VGVPFAHVGEQTTRPALHPLIVARRRVRQMKIDAPLGLATIDEDVTPELARATIASVSVLGAFHATPAVKAALADRTR
jgi:hypothetical protein